MKELYSGNYKTLGKETEEDTIKWRDKLCSQTKRINTVKMSILLRATSRFNVIPIKIPIAFFTQLE